MNDIDALAQEAVQRAKGDLAMVSIPEADGVMARRRSRHLVRNGAAAALMLVVLGGGVAAGVVSAQSGSRANVARPPVRTGPATLEFAEVLEEQPPSADGSCPAGTVAAREGIICYTLGAPIPAPPIASAQTQSDPFGDWRVDVTFTNDDFVRTVANPFLNKQVAIVVDDVVVSAPVINPGVTGRIIAISGDFTEADAEALAARLTP